MDNMKAEKIILLENGEEKKESFDSGFEDIDEALNYFEEYDTSKFPINANRVTFNLYEVEDDDFAQSVFFSKFKDEWYGSTYHFNFKGFYMNNLLFSVDGTEIDIADYLYKNISKINSECNLKLNIEDFKSKIEPDDMIVEDLIAEMNTNEAKFEFLDI
ncbi:hypothetical protein P5G62_005580 [Neobacillus sp. 179-C4.2 HS]|uniref:Uncharacterized protein n=1 Tax=Neobacillus driksii TaxID=3035913 RepID=A0ABV4YNZ7_9BACI|nr:hypothetical protein [Neobacillus sp. 179.-C4.2 HS]MDP5197175.1 hypothetical protein [Neobacillus sp. 179.-C4.2 HS]